MCEYFDIVKIVVYVLMLIILMIGIRKSLKINKLGWFLVAILIDLIIFLGIYLVKNNVCEDALFVNNETTEEKTTTTSGKTTKLTTTTDNKKRTSKGFIIEEKDGITYIDGYLVVNKTYTLPDDYIPTSTHTEAGDQKYCQTCIIDEAWEAYNEMKSDATALGLNIYIASGYRSYKAQEGLYNNYVARDGKEAADTYSARPGHSEHQSGYAFDLNSVTDEFANTQEGKWVNEKCYEYGFIIRYPKGKEDETGYKYESWHLRYVGKELAKKLYNNGDWITMEDYFGIKSQYAN